MLNKLLVQELQLPYKRFQDASSIQHIRYLIGKNRRINPSRWCGVYLVDHSPDGMFINLVNICSFVYFYSPDDTLIALDCCFDSRCDEL